MKVDFGKHRVSIGKVSKLKMSTGKMVPLENCQTTSKYLVLYRVLVCDCACVRHTRACGNLGAMQVRNFMELCVRMCVHAWFFGCVTRVRSHLKFFNKMMKKRLKTKVFLCQSGILTFTSKEFQKNNRNNALVFK